MRGKIFKIILIGDGRVGKTSIRRRYFEEGFESEYMATIGADFAMRRVDDRILQIWDLAGQNLFQQFRKNYYQGAHGALLVFDLIDKESFDNLEFWLDEVGSSIGKQIPTVLLGNKFDLVDNQQKLITDLMVKNKIDTISEFYDLELSFMKTSALTGLNVYNAFDHLIDKIVS